MTRALVDYNDYSRKRRRDAARKHQRLDIQGLRMVAVLAVFANHLWGWPHGGFVGVDVFFVISGFLITGNLLRDAEKRGTVSFRQFYWNRVRRIVPAATVVLLLTYLASMLVFMPFRSEQIGVDALFAFAFLSNWWFGYQGTDYFRAETNSVSPLQHYWSLSIEEQFYFVWPALIFLISVVVLRKAWTHQHRMRIAGYVMAGIVALSLGWSLYETATSPAWAYFNTFARVWELGIGAILATAVGTLARIPTKLRPWLSWGGLALITVSLAFIAEGSPAFPAPWALLPVAGAALVIAAGVGEEPTYQGFLRNPVSGYIGDISYSLYLVHWPIIVILGSLMDAASWPFAVTVVATAFMLAIASYHFVENPLRRADWPKFTNVVRDIRKRRYRPEPSAGYAAVAVLALLTVAMMAYVVRPDAYRYATPSLAEDDTSVDLSAADFGPPLPPVGPLGAALQQEIAAAAEATEWPPLVPSMEDVITGDGWTREVARCVVVNDPVPDPGNCLWGSSSAPTQMVLVGDSIAGSYAGALRDLAESSQGQISVYSFSLGACVFGDRLADQGDAARAAACPARKQAAIDYINQTRPAVVIIANTYRAKRDFETKEDLSPVEWVDSMRVLVDQFRGAAGKVALLAPPPAGPEIGECYGRRGSVPDDCAGRVTKQWLEMAHVENELATSVGGTWVDSRPWFCVDSACPAFAGSTPTRRDRTHLVPEYGAKISPVMGEALRQAGVI